MGQKLPIFLSDGEAKSLEKKENVLAINIGQRSPFANMPPRDPWVIDRDVDGIKPFDLWFGLTRVVGRNLSHQFEAGIKLVNWICQQITQNNLDPFQAISQSFLPEGFVEYWQSSCEYEAKVAQQVDRAEVYLVNGLYFVAGNISEDPGVLSAQYHLLPHNRVDYSVVYNPEWGKMSVGANTLGTMPQGSAAMLVWQNLAAARKMYFESGKVYLPNVLNLDILTAAMLVQGYDLPFAWIKYVEALKLGNFSDRLNKRVPELTKVGEKLSAIDETKGSWGGSLTFQGSSRGERTSVTTLSQVLTVMAEIFPKAYEGVEPVLLIRPGKK